MPVSRILALCVAALLACTAVPVQAGQYFKAAPEDHIAEVQDSIFELENLIAFVQADPRTDDGYKAPIIADARGQIRRLRAQLGPARWQWTSPCCYGRKPIVIH